MKLELRNISDQLFYVGLLLAVLPYIYLLNRFALNLPHGDDFYAIIGFFEQMHESDGFLQGIKNLFYTEKEHINVVARTISYAQYMLLGNFSFREYTFISHIFLVLILVLLYRQFLYLNIGKIYFLPVLFFVLNVSYWEISIKGLMSVQHFGVIYFSLLSFVYITKQGLKNLILAALFSILATYTFGNGILTFFICGLVLVVQNRKKDLIIWSIISAFFVGITLLQVLEYSSDGLRELPLYIKVRFFFNLFAGFLGSKYLYSSFFVGLALIGSTSYLLVKNQLYKQQQFITSLVLFIVGSYLLTTLRRANRGLMVSFIARYPIYASLLLVCLFFILMYLYKDEIKLLLSAVVLSVFVYVNSWAVRIKPMNDRHYMMLEGFDNWVNTGKDYWLRDGLDNPANTAYTNKFNWFVENEYYRPPYELSARHNPELQK